MTGGPRDAAAGVARRPAVAARRLLLLPAVLWLLAASTAPAAGTSVGQAAEHAAPATLVDMVLTRVDAIVTDGQQDVVVVARVHNPGPVPLTDVAGTMAVHARVRSRSAYHQALDDGGGSRPTGGVRGVVERSLPDLAAGDTRFLVFEASATELGLSDAEPAVHPVAIALRGRQADGRAGTLASATTALVVADPAPARPLQTALLLPLDTDLTAALPDVTAIVRSLSDVVEASGVPVSVTVDNALARAEDRRDPDDLPEPALSTAVRRLLELPNVQRLAVPYAEADLSALHRGGLDDLARLELRLGARPWPGARTSPVDDIAVPSAALDPDTAVEIVARSGTDTVVVDRSLLAVDAADEPPTTPSPVRPLSSRPGAEPELTALVPDPWLRDALSRRPALEPADVQRIVAETALLHLERPGAEEQRGVLLAPPDAAELSAEGLGDLLAALRGAPWAAMTDVATVPDDVTAGGSGTLVYDDAALAAELPPAYVEDIAEADETLDALRRILGPEHPELLSLRDNVLRATSTDFRGDLAAGRALLSTVLTAGTELLGAVEVIGRPTITFTDATGQLPVVLRNNSAVPLTVRVQLSSSRLRFPANDRDVRLEGESTTTVVFDAQARTPGGTAPVDVTITDPGAMTELATGTVVVRIAAYPLLALLLIGGAAAAIVLWWVRDLRNRRRGPHETAETPAAHVDAA